MVKAPVDYPGKKYRGRYCYEHHLVWWENTGELNLLGRVIHHINHDKHDNDFRNLEMMTISEHAKHHHDMGDEIVVCMWCKKDFKKRTYLVNLSKKTGRKHACSKRCVALHVIDNGGFKGKRRNKGPTHGTSSAYAYHKCRCDICRLAHNKRMREYKAKKKLSQVG